MHKVDNINLVHGQYFSRHSIVYPRVDLVGPRPYHSTQNFIQDLSFVEGGEYEPIS